MKYGEIILFPMKWIICRKICNLWFKTKRRAENETPTPRSYNRFKEKYPEIGARYEELGHAVHHNGPLSERERALVKLAISGSQLYHSAFKAHIRKAIAAGLTRAEIEHVALLMLPTVGFPTMKAALGLIEEQFESESPMP
jgi:4-carboxymuconolactone decarboxylase